MRFQTALSAFLRTQPNPHMFRSQRERPTFAKQKEVGQTEISFQLVFERAPFAALITQGGYIQFANYAMRVFLGATPTLDQKIADIFPVKQEIRPLLSAAQKAIRQQVPTWHAEKMLTDSTNRQKYFRVWVLLLNHAPKPFVCWVFEDITTEKNKEKRLRSLTKERNKALAETAAKTAFLANTSHELRTPLNAILGFAQAIESETFGPLQNPQYRTYLNYIIAGGQHLLSLINDILDLSGLEAGKQKLHEQPIQLYPLLQNVLVLVSRYPDAQNRQISLNVVDPDILLKADERALKQVFLNLISNAIKFTNDQGRIQITVTRLKSGGVRIGVKDDGIGIAKDKINELFHPFAQVENTKISKQEGTGLGLVLVKKLVESHQGSVQLKSKLGQGTNILVEFPAERVIK